MLWLRFNFIFCRPLIGKVFTSGYLLLLEHLELSGMLLRPSMGSAEWVMRGDRSPTDSTAGRIVTALYPCSDNRFYRNLTENVEISFKTHVTLFEKNPFGQFFMQFISLSLLDLIVESLTAHYLVQCWNFAFFAGCISLNIWTEF